MDYYSLIWHELIYILTFDKKRTLFREIRLKSSKVNFRWVSFNLTKIRIDGKIESKIVGQTNLSVESGRKLRQFTGIKRIPLHFFKSFNAPHCVRHYFNLMFWLDIIYTKYLTIKMHDPR